VRLGAGRLRGAAGICSLCFFARDASRGVGCCCPPSLFLDSTQGRVATADTQR
jgi:hypothetical protein